MLKHILWLLAAAMPIAAGAQTHLYLSPEGNDLQGNGSKTRPYRTVNKAVESGGETQSRDTLYIEIEPGDYFIDQPIRFEGETGQPVVIRSASIEKPRFIGGFKVEGWEPWKDGIWRAYVPQVLNGQEPRQFFINGERASLARTPDKALFKVRAITEIPLAGEKMHSAHSVHKIECEKGQLSSLPKGDDYSLNFQPKARFYYRWDTVIKHIERYDTDSSMFYITGQGSRVCSPFDNSVRFFLYDYMEALDSPGEWFCDRESGCIYYYPKEGEDLSKAECIVPTVRHLVALNNVSDVMFKGLSFQYSAFDIHPLGEEATQGAALLDAAVIADSASGITFLDCEFQHTGDYGIWFRRAAAHNVVQHCYLNDLGGGGVKIGTIQREENEKNYSNYNVIDNNIITNCGLEFPCACGVMVLYAAHNRITHNEISDLRYSGVSLGFIWDYINSPTFDNYVGFNHIHHIGWGELGDMGAIYTLGVSPGTVIENNTIHDIISYGYGGWGLYTDGASSDILWRNNLAYRCKSGGFHQDLGKENVFENNIFALGCLHQAQFTFKEDHLSFYFRRNIILQDRGNTLDGDRWYTANTVISKNLYWAIGESELRFSDTDGFKDWKEKKEPDAVNLDPLFVDPLKGDFRFRSTKNIKKIGFKPFDYTKAGVYGSEEWKKKAGLSPEKTQEFDKAVEPFLYFNPVEW